MSDFNGAKPVKTERDNDIKLILVDGESGSSATAKLSVIANGGTLTDKYGVLVFGEDGSGNAAPIPIGTTGIVVEGAVTVSGTVDIGNTVTVDAADLDIRNLTFADDSVDVSGSNINANLLIPGKICKYNTTATVGVNNETLHFHVVASGKTFSGKDLLVGARGAVKVRFGISTDGVAMGTVLGTYFQDPKENHDHAIECVELVGDGTKAICVGITNLDAASSDVYSTIQGSEVA